MLITLNHKATGVQATISTEGFDPDETVKPIIDADNPDLRELLINELNDSSGIFGHLIDIESTTNLDLAAAARKLEYFDFVSIDREIEPSNLPEDVNT
jgi:hypothetical protein